MLSKEDLLSPVRFLQSTYTLFATKRFRPHRLWGFLYLMQYFSALVLELRGTPSRALFWTMPMTGFIQTIIACNTFTFLPRANDQTQGYYHETKAMSYDFILENVYFSGLLLFQSLYICFASTITQTPLLLPLEILCVFLPYYTLRNFFPKSSFRHSTKDGNRYAMVVKFFYCIAKHMSGYYVNYLIFLGKLGPDPISDYQLLRALLLLGGWGTTIAMFLQTLKFKKYISTRAAMILYAGSFPLFYTCYLALVGIAMQHAWVTSLAVVGLGLNFGPRSIQVLWQIVVASICVASRYGS